MRLFEFTVVLAKSEVSETDCDALYSAGCDDATIVTREGVTYLAFDREAESLEEAIRSAIANVRAAGFDVAKVEMESVVL